MTLTPERIKRVVDLVEYHARFDEIIDDAEQLARAYARVAGLLERWEVTECDWNLKGDAVREDMIADLRRALTGEGG